MNAKKIITTGVLISAAVLLGIKGKHLLEKRKLEIKTTPPPQKPKISIELVTPKPGVLVEKTPFEATLLAKKSIKLSTKLAGYIKEIYVNEADDVKKDQVLLKIDPTELKSNIQAIKSAIKAEKSDLLVAKSIYTRNQKLYKAGGISKEMLELSHVALKAKEAKLNSSLEKLKSLQNQLTYLFIKAPFDAKVDALFMHKGDLAVTARPILSLSSKDQKIIFLFTPLKDHIKVNQKVFLKNKEIGKIKTIYNIAKNSLATAEVAMSKKINLPINSNLNIEVITNAKKGCVLPDKSILHKKDGEYIMLYKNGHFEPKKVDVLLSVENKVLIPSCPSQKVAKASEAKLAALPAHANVVIVGENDE